MNLVFSSFAQILLINFILFSIFSLSSLATDFYIFSLLNFLRIQTILWVCFFQGDSFQLVIDDKVLINSFSLDDFLYFAGQLGMYISHIMSLKFSMNVRQPGFIFVQQICIF